MIETTILLHIIKLLFVSFIFETIITFALIIALVHELSK
jgi:hypothetical protein